MKTTIQAKTIIRDELCKRNLPYTKLTARRVSFMDLARCGRVFVQVHGWQSGPAWSELETIAKQNGFYIE